MVNSNCVWINPDSIKSILILFNGGLGNTVLLLPIVKIIREDLRNAKLYALTNLKINKELLELSGMFDEVILAKRFVDSLIKCRRIKPYIVINPFPALSSRNALISYLTGAEIRIGFRGHIFPYSFFSKLQNFLGRPDFDNHELKNNREILRILDVMKLLIRDYIVENPRITLYDANDDNPKKFNIATDKPIIAICTETRTLPKWSMESFEKLIRLVLERHDVRIVILGGNKKDSRGLEIPTILNLSGKTTIREALEILSKSKLLVSSDTGLVHCACALGIPVIAIFGPTDVKKSRPLGESTIIRNELPCSPCYEIGRKIKCKDIRCFSLITPEEVFNCIEKYLWN